MANDEDEDFDYFLGADVDEEDFILATTQAERDKDQNIGFGRQPKRRRICLDDNTQEPVIVDHGFVDDEPSVLPQIAVNRVEKALWLGNRCKTVDEHCRILLSNTL